jgi:cation diffusion facilitator CzcD-associated flavoprotein CzcO
MSPPNVGVAVIGAGPVGLAAAAHLITRKIPVRIYEAGDTIAANVRDWGHVRLFSPWSLNTDQAAKIILKQHGWRSFFLRSKIKKSNLVDVAYWAQSRHSGASKKSALSGAKRTCIATD